MKIILAKEFEIMTNAEISKVLQRREKLLKKHPLRKGQAFFMALNELFPEKARLLINTEYDPYYQDKRIHKCINLLTKL